MVDGITRYFTCIGCGLKPCKLESPDCSGATNPADCPFESCDVDWVEIMEEEFNALD